MIKVALIDGQKSFLDDEKTLLKKWFECHSIEMIYSLYTHPIECLMDLEDETRFDLYFVGIEMEGMNGFELAASIRTYDYRSVIIFVTAHEQYARKGYEYNAWRYILKKDIKSDIPKALEELIPLFNETTRKTCLLKISRGTQLLYLDELIYIQTSQKYTSYHRVKAQEPIRVRQSLKEALEDLNDDAIVLISRDVAVNMEYVIALKEDRVCLRNGKELEISRRKVRTFRESFTHFALRRSADRN